MMMSRHGCVPCVVVALSWCIAWSHNVSRLGDTATLVADGSSVALSESFDHSGSLVNVVCPVGSQLQPNGTHHFVVESPLPDRYIRLRFNGTLGGVPKSTAFEGEGLARVRILDMSHQGIESLSRMDSDTFQLFRDNIVYINLAFNAIVRIDSNAFDGFRPLRTVKIDLSNNNLNCQQVCVLLSLRQPSFEYKGECEDASGQTISFSSLEADAPHYCEDVKTDGTFTTTVKTAQSASGISDDNSNTNIYVGIGVVAPVLLLLAIISLLAFLVFRQRKNNNNPHSVSSTRTVVNMNPIYGQRKMSGASTVSNTSRSSENVLYEPSDNFQPKSETLNSDNPRDKSDAFHIYEDADAVKIRMQNPMYESSGEE